MHLKELCTVCLLLMFISALFSGCSHDAGPAGRVYSDRSYGGGSGVYVGDGYMLTNWHVAENIPGKADLFSLPLNGYSSDAVVVPIEKVLFSKREIELALVRLTRPIETSHAFSKICLSTNSVKYGEHLMIMSSPGGYFPPETVAVTVIDDLPRMRPDSDKSIESAKKVVTIVGLTPEYKSQLVAPGSSGGAVLNKKGELVGLVWGRNLLRDGKVEAWITPVSSWRDQLDKATEISDNERQVIYNLYCK